MELKSLSIGRKAITFSALSYPEDGGGSTPEEIKVTSQQAPLIDLTNAFSKLAPVMCRICEWEPGYQDMLFVKKISISYTKAGTRSVKFVASKQLNSRRDHLHTFECPFVQIDKNADGESGEVQVDKKDAVIITAAIKEAERYAAGERSANPINFDEAKDALNATADQGRDLLAGVQ